jgi:hypothetical protein
MLRFILSLMVGSKSYTPRNGGKGYRRTSKPSRQEKLRGWRNSR